MFCDVVPGENPELEKYTNAEEFSCKVSNAHKSTTSIKGTAPRPLNCRHRRACCMHPQPTLWTCVVHTAVYMFLFKIRFWMLSQPQRTFCIHTLTRFIHSFVRSIPIFLQCCVACGAAWCRVVRVAGVSAYSTPQPVFALFMQGKEVGMVHGCDAPALEKIIMEHVPDAPEE